MNIEINIKGSGTSQEIATVLRQIAENLNAGMHIDSINERGECIWEDECLLTEISEE